MTIYQKVQSNALLLSLLLAWLLPGQRPVGHCASISVGGVGILLRESSLGAEIVGILPGSPAERGSNIFRGNVIIAVAKDPPGGNFVSAVGKTTDEIATMIRGSLGTLVALKILPTAQTPIDEAIVVELRREGDLSLRPDPGAPTYSWTNRFSPIELTWTNATNHLELTVSSFEVWSRITNGSPASFVSSVLGFPIIRHENQPPNSCSTWSYGLTVSLHASRQSIPFTLHVFLRDDEVFWKTDFAADGTNKLQGQIIARAKLQ